MILNIKNMVSHRCEIVVGDVLTKNKVQGFSVRLGRVEIKEKVTTDQYKQIHSELLKSGLDILVDKKRILIEEIKTIIIDLIHQTDEKLHTNFSDHLSAKLKYNYTYLSSLFSTHEGISIERFIIKHKIERIKELISYNELNLKQISFKLHYSSAAHLSRQFKKETGISPSKFRAQKEKVLTHIERL